MRCPRFLLFALVLPLPLEAQAVDTLRLAATPFGATRCVAGVPVTTLRPGLPTGDSLQIEAHEAVHRAQLAGDCEATLARITASPEGALLAEAPAYCSQMRVALTLYRADPLVYWQGLTLALWRHFEGHFTPLQIVEALKPWCPAIPY